MKKENSKEANVPAPVKTSLIKDGFFGWKNIKWGIKEFINIYSNKDSYFSKKRIESGVAFIVMQWGMIAYFMEKHQGMDVYDLVIWASIEGIICGYTINKIQKEKLEASTTGTGSDTPPFE